MKIYATILITGILLIFRFQTCRIWEILFMENMMDTSIVTDGLSLRQILFRIELKGYL